MSQKLKKAVIILPTYNERENLESFTEEVLAQEKDAPGWRFELLVVDSHSPDGTFELAEKLAANNPNIHTLLVGPGLGVGIIEGHQYSLKHLSPDGMVQLDSDGQTSPDVIPRLLKALDDGYNLALGSRFIKGGKNNLTFMRKLFTWGSCLYCRVVMGPLDIGEFTNSARAFTPELFNKVDLSLVPWREKTFIIQPAFLNAAVVAGAKYKEVPLVFKNRAEGYSKNKTFGYTFDILTYAIDARLKKMGIKFPFFAVAHKATTLIKFSVVGFTGTFVDFIIYKLLINMAGLDLAMAKGISTEFGIINNFLFNNFWTFRHRKTSTNIFQRFGIYNLVSLGGLAIAVGMVQLLDNYYGDPSVLVLGRLIKMNNFYFFATIPPVMIWNFTINHFVTWRNQPAKAKAELTSRLS